MSWGRAATYDAWKLRSDLDDYPDRVELPDHTYFDDDAAAAYFAELEELDELAVFFETHEQVSN